MGEILVNNIPYFINTTKLNSWFHFARVTVSNYSVILNVITHRMCNCDTEICLSS